MGVDGVCCIFMSELLYTEDLLCVHETKIDLSGASPESS